MNNYINVITQKIKKINNEIIKFQIKIDLKIIKKLSKSKKNKKIL